MVHGMRTPHSPQNIPSSETQRNVPHRSQRRGSTGSLRQTIVPHLRTARTAWVRTHREEEKEGVGSSGSGSHRALPSRAPAQAFFILARETNPFLSRKYM